jgi:hypothetical protein
MKKVDYKKSLASYRAQRDVIELVDMPTLQYLMVDGHGDPNEDRGYGDALAALYAVSYALKFASKQLDQDYVVPPLEGLWWAEDMSMFTTSRDKGSWSWTMMIMAPEWVDAEMLTAAKVKVAKKKLASVSGLRLATLAEGRCVQVLHVGSYDDEGPILARLHNDFLPENHLEPVGKHHEIYLGDPRRVAPEKLKTILRQPVRPTQLQQST